MSFGSARLSEDGRSWIIQCEPHVRTRLRRVFAKITKHASQEIVLSNTPENCRDLEWFTQRYPLEVSGLTVLAQEAQEHRDVERRLEELLEQRGPPPVITLAKPPREYQEVAAQLLTVVKGYLLADDVGLGKTVSAICPMVDPANLPAVVVCPAHMPRQWVEKLNEFAPRLRVHRVKAGTVYPLVREVSRQVDMWAELPDVIVISYHMLRGWAETLAKVVRLAVFDECQQLRNPDSRIYSACKHLAEGAAKVMGLSATPIYNYGAEFFWVIDILRRGALGTREEFLREWCGGESRISDTLEFGRYLRREGIMLRRTRRDVGRELPALTRIAHTIDCESSVLERLSGSAIELAKVVLAHNEAFRGQRMQAAGEFDALMRQATGVAKAPFVAEFVRLLIENGERVVLFGWHREVYTIWMERLKDLDPLLYTGSESASQKHESLRQFVGRGSNLLIMSLRSGAGVDGLQASCRTAVFGELDWSPGVHEQCMGRLHRDGQPEPVMAYYLLSTDGADPVMAEVLGVKREQIEGVRNPGADLIERIETGEDHIRRLARELLGRRGVAVPEEPVVTSLREPAEADA